MLVLGTEFCIFALHPSFCKFCLFVLVRAWVWLCHTECLWSSPPTMAPFVSLELYECIIVWTQHVNWYHHAAFWLLRSWPLPSRCHTYSLITKPSDKDKPISVHLPDCKSILHPISIQSGNMSMVIGWVKQHYYIKVWPISWKLYIHSISGTFRFCQPSRTRHTIDHYVCKVRLDVIVEYLSGP